MTSTELCDMAKKSHIFLDLEKLAWMGNGTRVKDKVELKGSMFPFFMVNVPCVTLCHVGLCVKCMSEWATLMRCVWDTG